MTNSDNLPHPGFDQSLVTIQNPLVVIIGIGDFKGEYRPLIGVPQDYKNVIFSLNYTRGYHVVYYNPKNELIHLKNRANKSKYYQTNNFKITWNKKEITQFNKIIKKKFLTTAKLKAGIVNHKNVDEQKEKEKEEEEDYHHYDSLIYIIASHGDQHGVIYDSDMTEIKVDDIIQEFNNVNCKALMLKPKIFILDHCRGRKRASMKLNSLFQDYEERLDEARENNLIRSEIEAKKQEKEDYNKKDTLQNPVAFEETVTVSPASHIRTIFSNTDGYAVPDGGVKGGYLIRCFTKVITNDDWFKGLSFNRIMLQTRLVLQKYLGVKDGVTTQVIDDTNTMPCGIALWENERVLPKGVTIRSSRNATVCYHIISCFDCSLNITVELSKNYTCGFFRCFCVVFVLGGISCVSWPNFDWNCK